VDDNVSDIDLAVRQCKELESILRTKHGADGKGLHQLVTSVESRLPPDLIRVLRRIATIRNKIVHEEDYRRLDDKRGFLADCAAAKKQLQKLGRRQRRYSSNGLLVLLLFVLLVAAVVAYVLGWTSWIR
jgi:hypothetical protein